MKADIAVQRLGALAQKSRLAVYRLLVQAGAAGLCASDIGARLKVSPATLSFHLKALSAAGLVSARQDGRFIYYAPEFRAMNQLIDYLTENCCGGAPCGTAGSAPCEDSGS